MRNECTYKSDDNNKATYCFLCDCYCPDNLMGAIPTCYKKKSNVKTKKIDSEERGEKIMRRKEEIIRATLDTQGVNSNQYVSLSDLQKVLGQYLPQPSVEKQTSETTMIPFAKNSGFYNKIMADGNVFNPYLHRRFLPVQYLKMIQDPLVVDLRHKCNNFEDALARNYNFQYSINYTKKEVKKLAFLEWSDRVSFEERSCFFSIPSVKTIISDYVNEAIEYIDNIKPVKSRKGKNRGFYGKRIKGRGYIAYAGYYEFIGRASVFVDSKEVAGIKNELMAFKAQINRVRTYKELSNRLEAFDYVILPKNTNKSKAFIDVFKGSGAYYTIKHLIMFEGCNTKQVYSLSSNKPLQELRELLVTGTSLYKFHGMLKELLVTNQYSQNN